MAYLDTKEFLLHQAKREAIYKISFDKKLKAKSFTESELFCLGVFRICKKLSEPGLQLFNPKPLLSLIGARKGEDGWFYLNKEFGKGKFINASAIFKNAMCEEDECHSCAYSFAINYIGGVSLLSGLLNPYNLNVEMLHSVCEFEMNGERFVFDGANYLVMDRDLYYKIYNFKPIQILKQEEVLKDRILLSSSSVFSRGIIKNAEKKFALVQDTKAVMKHFSGAGFLFYLYDRESSINPEIPEKDRFKQNLNLMQEMEEIKKNEESGIDSDKVCV